MHISPYKRQSLALFFIVSLIPALVVAAIWYLDSQLGTKGNIVFTFKDFVLPIFLMGVIPAMFLSYVFAELLSRPVRRIHAAVVDLSQGKFDSHFQDHNAGEFKEIGQALDAVALQLQLMLSEAATETEIISAERNKLSTVLNSMTEGVFALDQAGRIVLFNKAASRLTGRSIESVAGQLSEKVMPFRKNGELIMTRWLATDSSEKEQIGNWRGLELYRVDGTVLNVDVKGVLLPADPNGIRALITFYDLTARVEFEQMKVDFVALAAHELRTPLTEIKGYLDILIHEAKGLSKSNQDFLERSMASANQLSGLVNNLLGVARIEHGELNYQPEIIDYLSFMAEISHEFKQRADQQNRELKLIFPAKLPPIYGDIIGLREVLTNLVVNAIAYTLPVTGKITITLSHKKGFVETAISDNGAGIPESSIPHLFTKFYRADEMRATTHGTGLGLYICRSIVEAHGGRIWVESELGRGSAFIFQLPVSKVALETSSDHNKKITRGAHGWIKDHTVS